MPNNILDPFKNGAYDMATLTESVNNLTPVSTRYAGLFSAAELNCRTAVIDYTKNKIAIIDPVALGVRGKTLGNRINKAVGVDVPYFPLEASLTVDDIRDQRRAGTAELELLDYALLDKLSDIRDSHETTHEFMRARALQGKVVDSKGTVILDIWKKLKVADTAKQVDTSAKDFQMQVEVLGWKRKIEKGLMGSVATGFAVDCSPAFFDKFIALPSVRNAYMNWAESGQRNAGDMRDGFPYAGMLFRENADYSLDDAGKEIAHIEAGKAVAYPLGTTDVFKLFIAPGEFLDTVNSNPDLIYVRQKVGDYNQRVDLHSESSVLPVCVKPSAIMNLSFK